MNKKFVMVIVLLVVVLAAPAGGGYLSRMRLETVIASMNRNNPDLNVTLVKYSQGWLASDVEITVEAAGDFDKAWRQLQKAKGADMPMRLRFRGRLQHGPLPLQGKGIAFRPMLGGMHLRLVEAPGGVDLSRLRYEFIVTLGLTGGGNAQLRVPKVRLDLPGNVVFDWQGGYLRIGFDTALTRIDAKGEIPALSFAAPGKGGFVMKGLRLEGDSSEPIEDLPIGDAEMEIKNIRIDALDPRTGQGKQVAIDDLQIHSKGSFSKGLVDYRGSVSVSSFQAGRFRAGPARMVIRLERLHGESLAKLNRGIREMKRNAGSPQEKGMMMMGLMFGTIGPLLEHGPTLTIEPFSIQTPEGTVTGRLRLGFDTSNKAALGNIFTLKNAVVADMAVDVPQKVLLYLIRLEVTGEMARSGATVDEQEVNRIVQARLRQMLETSRFGQMFQLDNGVYRFRFHLEKGRMTLNGRPYTPRPIIRRRMH